MSKKIVFVMLIVLYSSVFFSCTGPAGDAYQKYWWAGSLLYFYDTNPSTPYTIYNDVYFPTDPGRFYMEYTAFDGSSWYMYYTITVKDGAFFVIPGDDTWFEIGLYSFGPSLYQWDSAKSLSGQQSDEMRQDASSRIGKTDLPISSGRTKSDILGVQERRYVYGSMKLEYGKILD